MNHGTIDQLAQGCRCNECVTTRVRTRHLQPILNRYLPTWTPKQIADATGLTRSTIYRIRNGNGLFYSATTYIALTELTPNDLPTPPNQQTGQGKLTCHICNQPLRSHSAFTHPIELTSMVGEARLV